MGDRVASAARELTARVVRSVWSAYGEGMSSDPPRRVDEGMNSPHALGRRANHRQDREREVDDHVIAGRVNVHADGAALLQHLDRIATT